MRSFSVALAGALLLLASTSPGFAQSEMLARAIADASASFARAVPSMGQSFAGVDVAAYGIALNEGRVGNSAVDYVVSKESDANCRRFAAYVVPAESGTRLVFLCPRFFTPGADGLRTLTILHELVHVVADTNECRAMAFTAQVEQAARGSFTPVEAYWQRNGCESSAFSLPR